MKVRLCLLLLAGLAGVWPAAAETPNVRYENIPLIFEPNLGQTDAAVRFFSRGNGYGLFLTDAETVVSLAHPAAAVVRMRLTGQSRDAQIEGLEPQSSSSHYFLGNEPVKAREAVPHFSKVRYRGIYPGIDLTYYGNQQQLEYDFIVGPQADPASIEMDFSGVDYISLNNEGDLVLHTAAGNLVHRRPVAFQELNGTRHMVPAEFVLYGHGRAGFEVGAYDPNLPLVIDPVLVYSTYFGGTATTGVGDQGSDVAIDGAGSAYIAGHTVSTDFWLANAFQPSQAGGLDAFVMKLGPDGGIAASSYFGGSGNDEGHSIALDASGNIYVAGSTTSSNLPVVNAFQSTRGGLVDAFVLKLNSAADTILYSTYLGGSGEDRALGIAVDPAGNAFVTGASGSPNFPTRNAAQGAFAGGLADGFITKLSPTGQLVYSTYLGGIGNDQAYDIDRDAEGNAYVVGFTTSVNFPTRNPLIAAFSGGTDDAFVAKINSDGTALAFATYFGGTGSDNAVGLTLDSENNVYVTGYTSSLDLPLKNAFQFLLNGDGQQTEVQRYDAFLIKLNAEGSDAFFSTYIGGDESESGVDVDLDAAGNIYVAGFTGSFQFYLINAYQNFINGFRDGFVMKLAPDISQIVYSTYIGGFGNEGAVGMAVDNGGNVFLTGYSTSPDFPLSANAFQPSNVGGVDGFIAKINADDVKTSSTFSLPAQGGTTMMTSGGTAGTIFGFATADAAAAEVRPTGFAMVDFRSQGLLTTEMALPLVPYIQYGRMFVQERGGSHMALSLVNPTAEEVTVEFLFTSQEGTDLDYGSFLVPAATHFAGLLRDAPFNILGDSQGTLTITASAPISMIGLRTFSSQTASLLLSHVPIADLTRSETRRVTVPQFTDGQGWTTQIRLVNTTDERMGGEIRFFGAVNPIVETPEGDEGPPQPPPTPVEMTPVEVTLEEGPSSVFEYDIPPRGAQVFQTLGVSEAIIQGYVNVVPFAGMNTPSASALLSLSQGGITTLDTPVEAQVPSRSFKLYVEATGNFAAGEVLSTRSTIALANPSDAPAVVNLELTDFAGTPAGSAQLTVPPRGHIAAFIADLEAFRSMPSPFEGVLRVSASEPGITVVGLHTRLNELGNFLATTTGPVNEDAAAGSTVQFPYLVEGGGYATRFVLLSGAGGQGTSGVIRFSNQIGQPLHLSIR